MCDADLNRVTVLVADGGGPVRAEELLAFVSGGGEGLHHVGDRRVVLGVSLPVVTAVEAWSEDACESVAFVHGPGDDQDVTFGQRESVAGRWGHAVSVRGLWAMGLV